MTPDRGPHPTIERPPSAARRRPTAIYVPNATLVEREPVGSTIVRLRVRPDVGVPAFSPGQYFAIGLASDGDFVQRPYSTSSPRGEAHGLEFLVRLVPGGALTPRLFGLAMGARLRVGPPKGLFTADSDDPRRPLLVGTGTGIAPLLSILETRLRESPAGATTTIPIVVHGASFVADLAGRFRLAALDAAGSIAYVPAVSRASDAANAGWGGAAGRLDGLLPDVLARHGVDPGATLAFVCGNPSLVAAAAHVLLGLGFPADAIRSEAWS
jgi:ferredoxin-NADP reductase